MIRLFLTLLALLTGLTEVSAPAHARMSGVGETEIGTLQGTRSGIRAAAGQSGTLDAPVARRERRERESMRTRPARARVYIPSVQIGIDRAAE